MTALWIGIAAGATAIAALLLAFVADRRSRDAIQRIDKLEQAPRAEGRILRTRSGERIGFEDLKGDLTLLVSIPARGADPNRLARLESLRHRFGSATLDVVAVPIGARPGDFDETTLRAGAIPVLATVDEHPLHDLIADEFTGIETNYSKLLVDGKGRVVARFGPEADPRGIEVRRAVEAALAN